MEALAFKTSRRRAAVSSIWPVQRSTWTPNKGNHEVS